MGIGTTAPDASAALDIVSSTKGLLLPRVAAAASIASPATGLIVFQTGAPAGFYYNAGTPAAPGWQQIATAAGAAVTASNGLTKTGADVALGGTLTQNTTIDQGSNTLGLTGTGNLGVGTASPGARLDVAGSLRVSNATQINQLATDGSVGGQASIGQSFTLPAGAAITQINVYAITSGAATLKLYQGAGFGGTELASQATTLVPGSGMAATAIVLTTPVAVAAAGPYTFAIQSAGALARNGTNPYPGGVQYGTGTGAVAGSDLKFAVYYTLGAGPASTLYATSGRVGVGTETPSQALEVAGQVFSSTGGFRFPDNTVQTTATLPTVTATAPLTGLGTAASPLGIQLASGSQGGYLSAADFMAFSNKGSFSLPALSSGSVLFSNGSSIAQNNASFFWDNANGRLGLGTSAPLGRLTVAGGSLLTYAGLNNTSARPAVGTARLAGEVAAVGQFSGATPSLGADDGFLRLSAGGGGTGAKSYIDLSGYSQQVDMYQNIVLGTNGQERLRILSGGNVGIGTDNPGQRLDVAGIGRFTATGPALQLAGSGSGSHTYLELYPNGSGASRGAYLGFPGAGSTLLALANETAGGDLALQAPHDAYLHAGGSIRLLAQGSTGNVGIGTTTPGTRLSISPTATEAKVTLYDGGSATGHYGLGVSNGQLNYHVLTATDRHVFYATGKNGDGTELLRIQGDGNVGIGTGGNAPGARLDVEGGGLLVGSSNGLATQGAHLQWNRSGGAGETWLINNLGTGNATTSGIRFGGATPNSGTAVAEWARFQNNGFFGLGTTSPGARLEVAGQVKITGGSPGLGKALVSDASGLATWEPVVGSTTFNAVQNQNTATQTAAFRISSSGRVDGENQGLIVDAGGAARVGLMKYANREAGLWRTSSQDFELGRVDVSDLTTATGSNTFTTDLYVDGAGNVGIGTGATAAARLHVGGTAGTPNVRLESLGGTGTRVVTADASGNLGSVEGSGSFILNQTGPAQTANFNVTGTGTVGGLLTASGGALITGSTNINSNGNAPTSIGNFNAGINLMGTNVQTIANNVFGVIAGTSNLGLSSTGFNVTGGGSLFGLGANNATLSTAGGYMSVNNGIINLSTVNGFLSIDPANGISLLDSRGTLSITSTGGVRLSNNGNGSALNLSPTGTTLSSLAGPLVLLPTAANNVGVGISTPSSKLQVAGAVALSLTAATANLTLDNTHHTVRCAAGCSQLTLPDASTCAGREYVLINSKTNTAAVALVPNGSQTVIDDTTGPAVTSLPIGSRYTIQSDGSNWVVIGR